MDTKALDAIWACLISGKKLRIEELARKTHLSREVVAEVIGFLAKYDFVNVAQESSSVTLRDDATSPCIAAIILQGLLSRSWFSRIAHN